MNKLNEEIRAAINRSSVENGSNTPDFILAQYLLECLAAYDKAVNARESWYGRSTAVVDAPVEVSKSKIIPLHDSTLPEEEGLFCCTSITLTNDREITVGHSEDGFRYICMHRPEPDGNICETKFGLTEEAAHALGLLLARSFKVKPLSVNQVNNNLN